MRRTGTGVIGQAFTLIELLIVVAILAILMGLVYLGIGDTLEWAKVNRSAYQLASGISEAKQAAMVRNLNHTIIINSAKEPRAVGEAQRLGMSVAALGQNPDAGDPDEADDVYRMTSPPRSGNPPYFQWVHGPRDGNGNPMWNWYDSGGSVAVVDASSTPPDFTLNSPNAGAGHAMNTRRWNSPLLSKKPEDQWFAVFGPYRDHLGRWQQVRGGMPTGNNLERDPTPSNPSRRGRLLFSEDPFQMRDIWQNTWSAVYDPFGGGIFGHPLNNLGQLPAGQIGNTNVWNLAGAFWDPYQAMVGSRRILERGTRWAVRSDFPEWVPQRSEIMGFYHVALPFISAARHDNVNDLNLIGSVTCFNIHGSSGLTSINRTRPTFAFPYPVSPPKVVVAQTQDNPDIGDSRRPEGSSDMYQNFTFALVSNKSKSYLYEHQGTMQAWTYARPVASAFVNVNRLGETVVSEKPTIRR